MSGLQPLEDRWGVPRLLCVGPSAGKLAARVGQIFMREAVGLAFTWARVH
jgi:hypothetical protein